MSENRASAEAAEREVSSELEKLLNTQRRYEDLLRSREGEREYFLQAREKLLEAQNRVKSWGSQEEGWGSQGKGLSKVTSLFSKGTQSPLPVLESRLSEFLSAVDSCDSFVQQLGGSLPKVDGLKSALNKLSEYTQKYLESSKRLCGYLKRQVVADQDKIKNLQEKIVDLESQLSDLRIDKTTKEESKDTELSLQAQKLGELQTQLNASKEDNGKLRRTLELYERLLRSFESKLEKKKHKDLEDFRTAKERLTSYQVYTREQILQGADQELFDKLESQRRELETRAAQLRDLSLSNDALQARVRNLESQVGNMTQALRTQQEQLSEKESKIAELQEKLLEESKKSSSANALVQAMTMSMSAEGRQRVLAITSPGTPSTETKPSEKKEDRKSK